MFANPFDGPRAKIALSKDWFDQLVSIQTEYSKAQNFEIELDKMPNGDTDGYAVVKEPPPVKAAAIAASIVGAFRSALDISVVQACIVRGQKNDKLLDKTYFAFGGSKRDWEGNLPRRMAGADAIIQDAVASFKPWKDDGNKLLYALSKLAAKDKHIQLMAIAPRGGNMIIDGLTTRRPDGKASKIQVQTENWGASNRVRIFKVFAPAEVEVDGPHSISPQIGFGKVYALTGKPIIPALNQMGAMCEKIIDTIEAAARS